ncbi:MAG: glycosyltransferase [Bacteroidales bacterium]
MGWFLFPVLVYSGLILYYTYYFYKKKYNPNANPIADVLPEISVIIPFRNEAQHIPSLVQSLVQLTYPANKIEFIWINDHSTDNSYELLSSLLTKQNFPYRYQIVSLEGRKYGKRMALMEGIHKTSYTLIATLDADCTVASTWLTKMAGTQWQSHADLIMGPVLLKQSKSVLSIFFAIEQLSLTATAAASAWAGNPILCSGANLVFFKSDFIDYLKHAAPPIPVGDDIFFMLYLKKIGKRIDYVASPDAIVTTTAPDTIGQFINQRIRWVSKSRYYADPTIIGVALIVAITNIVLVVSMGCAFFSSQAFKLWLTAILVKVCIDFPLLYKAAKMLGHEKIIRIYPLAQLIYPIFVTFVSIYGNFAKFSWKQRTIQHKSD